MKIQIDWNAWQPNPIFKLIQRTGKISDAQMRKVFNMGIGLIFIVDKKDAGKVSKRLTNQREKHYIIGEITK
jgi:phosphoribosylformylglycinamidine cyclo-ligase